MLRGEGESKAGARAGVSWLALATALAAAVALWLAGVSLAVAASPRYDLDGSWSITETSCAGRTAADGTLVVQDWSSASGSFSGTDTRGSKSTRVSGGESGDQMTLVAPGSGSNRRLTGDVVAGRSSLTVRLPLDCPSGGSGQLVLLNPNPASLATTNASTGTGKLAQAQVEGKWQVTVTVSNYHGGKPTGPRAVRNAVGHSATGILWLQEKCPGGGSCTLVIWGQAGPGDDGTGLADVEDSTNLTVPSPLEPLTKTGATFSETFGIGGYGGPSSCYPTGHPAPAESLSLRVVSAQSKSSAVSATGLIGTETEIEGWSCNGSTFVSWDTATVAIVAHPVGYKAPLPAAPLTVSSLAASLNPPGVAFESPGLIAVNLLIAAGLIVFITFPSAIFNHTLQANYEEIREFWERRVRWLRRVRERADPTRNRRRELMVFAAVLAVGAILNALLNPKFGLNGTTAVSYVATVATMAFGITCPGLVAHTYRRTRRRDQAWRMVALPVGLLLAGLCVLISRLTGFEPGYFYGLVCGVVFGNRLAVREEGHIATLAALTTMVLALLAWLGWSLIHQAASQPGAAGILIFFDDFLASVFVGGVVGCVVSLLPLRFLQGGTVAAWHRGAWVSVFLLAVFALIQVLLHPQKGAVHPSTAPVVTAAILFLGFGGASIAFNRYFAWSKRPTRLPAARSDAPGGAAGPSGASPSDRALAGSPPPVGTRDAEIALDPTGPKAMEQLPGPEGGSR
jgi:hypothetical protein